MEILIMLTSLPFHFDYYQLWLELRLLPRPPPPPHILSLSPACSEQTWQIIIISTGSSPMKSRSYRHCASLQGLWTPAQSRAAGASLYFGRWPTAAARPIGSSPFLSNRSVSVGSSNKRSGAVGQMTAPQEQKFMLPQCVLDARNCRRSLTRTHVFKPPSSFGRPASGSYCHLTDETSSVGFPCSPKAVIAYHHKLEGSRWNRRGRQIWDKQNNV